MMLFIESGSVWRRRAMSERLIVRGIIGRNLLVEDEHGRLITIPVAVLLTLYRQVVSAGASGGGGGASGPGSGAAARVLH
jgi:hypothetical protein